MTATAPYVVLHDQPTRERLPRDVLHLTSIDTKREPVTSVDLQDFLTRTFPPRELMMSPWLQRQGLAMVHGYRGFGKTLMAHGSAWAIGTGGGFWRWNAPEPRRVLILDGEMPASDLQVRLRNIQDNSELTPAPGFFRIAAADTFREGLPDLSNQSMQGFYSDVVADADFILLDNISTLCPGAQENDADAWAVMQAWILLLRRQGKSVLLVHHDGKGGQQRERQRRKTFSTPSSHCAGRPITPPIRAAGWRSGSPRAGDFMVLTLNPSRRGYQAMHGSCPPSSPATTTTHSRRYASRV